LPDNLPAYNKDDSEEHLRSHKNLMQNLELSRKKEIEANI